MLNNLITISASRLKTFRTCQRQHYYKYTLPKGHRPEEAYSVAALLGKALHKAIEMYYRKQALPSLTFQEYMLSEYEAWEKSGIKIKGEEYLSKSLKDGKDILKKMDFSLWNPTSLELKFDLPFPNPEDAIVRINGVIDLIDITGAVIDHKSSNRMPTQEKLDHDLQFLIYTWAYQQISGYMPYKVYWNHLRNGRLLEFNITHNYEFKLEQLTRDIQALIGTQDNIEYNQRRILDDVCVKECSFYTLCYGDKPPANILEDNIEE